MQVLIAHSGHAARHALERVAADAGHPEVIESCDGAHTLNLLLAAHAPDVAIVDWSLPRIDGLELCRLVRDFRQAGPPYIILLAGRDQAMAEGLDAGADDCVRTPVDPAELRARIEVGRRFAALPWERLAQVGAAHEQAAEEPFVSCDLRARSGETCEDEDEADPRHEVSFQLESVLVPE